LTESEVPGDDEEEDEVEHAEDEGIENQLSPQPIPRISNWRGSGRPPRWGPSKGQDSISGGIVVIDALAAVCAAFFDGR
jgi:hypothetical protein